MGLLKSFMVFCFFLVTVAIAMPGRALAGCVSVIDGVRYDDSDCDRIRDYDYDTDANRDGTPDGNKVDNCPTVMNGNCDVDPADCDADENGTAEEIERLAGFQADWNDNGIGDACDDTDSDTIPDYLDNCKTTANSDRDMRACTDTDYDTFEDLVDNCVDRYNPNQRDTDGDGFGDYCDVCPYVANPDQGSAACPDNGPVSTPSPAQSPAYVPPNPVVTGEDMVRGSGGCRLSAGAPQSAWALAAFFLALVLAAIRMKKN